MITQPSFRSIQKLIAVMILSSGLSACGKAAPESDGVIANVNGEVRKLTADEQKTICATQYCEPNYIFTTGHGRRHHRKPKPKPSVSPVRSPSPVPSPVTSPSPIPSPVPSHEPSPKPSPILSPAPSPVPSHEPSPAPSPIPSAPPSAGPIRDRLDYSRKMLNVQPAWAITQGSEEIVVAVIDTGVDYTHPDLKDNVVSTIINGKVTHGYDFTRNQPDAMDDNEHGTHCSGIIGAELNGLGIVGISPKVKILPAKFMDSDGSGTTENAIKAIRYAVDQGAKVLSMSWGGSGDSKLLAEEIQRAIDKGVYVVAAAGNDSSDNDQIGSFPANYPGVISVGSTDESDAMSDFSNYGPKSVSIGAPGSNILSTVPGGQYAQLSGTSMAAPQVSGAIALALSVSGSLTPDQVKGKLCESADKILLEDFDCGRMNVGKFIESLRQ